MDNLLTEKQLEAATFDKKNILVSASAGSGKTKVMIERICDFIAKGKATVDSILAITYTDASALEMKEKLRETLSRITNEGHSELGTQLQLISNSDICTIDAFCARLIRRYFFTVNINNDYKIIESNLLEEYKKIAINNVFNKHYKEGGKFLEYVDKFSIKRNDSTFREIILQFYNFISTEVDFEEAVKKYSDFKLKEILSVLLKYSKQIFLEYREKFFSLYQEFTEKKYADGIYVVQKTLEVIDEFVKSDDIYIIYNLEMPALSRKKGSADGFELEKQELQALKGKLSSDIREKIKAFISNEKDDEIKLQKQKDFVSYFYTLTREFKDEFDRLKLEENYLDFNDIEHYAIKILENEDIRKELQEKYKYIFVDEYQDVNNAQEYIINKLTVNNLFMVGDEKQSIYGFRGCHPEFFQNKFKTMQDSGEKTVELLENFRSAKEVVDSVNQVFSYCMTSDRYGLDYKNKSKLILGPLYGENFGRARLNLFIKDKKEKISELPRIYDIKAEALKEFETEDDYAVLTIYKIIQEELNKTYFNLKTKKLEKVMPKDIAILARALSNNEASNIIKGLTMRGINVTSLIEEDVCEFPEVVLFIDFLRLIDCFNQSLPLVNVLKSNIVGLDENDLCLIVEYYKNNVCDVYDFTFFDAFDYYVHNAKTELCGKLLTFCEYVKKMRLVSYYKTCGEILEEVINEFSLLAYFYAEKDGEIKVKRIERLVSFCNENATSIKTLLRIVDNEKNKITLANGGNENSVKFITMHSSKGLEFPVVIACNLNKQFNVSDKKNKALFNRRFGLATKEYDEENRTYKDGLIKKVFNILYDEKTEQEEMRLFYVALTRAQYSLHLQAIVEKDERELVYKGAKKMLDFVPLNFKTKIYTASELKEEHNGGNGSAENDSNLYISSNNKDINNELTNEKITEIKEKLNFKYKYHDETLLPLKSNVTEANKKQVDIFDAITLFNEGESSKKEQGTIAHRIMQYYDFNNEDFNGQISLMLNKNIVTEEEIKKIDLMKIKKVVCGEVISSIKGKKLYREQPFIMKIKANEVLEKFNNCESEILLQGVIDLLAIDENGAEIIDYKYSSKGEISLKESYKKQLDLYANAVTKVLGLKVNKKSIVSLLTGDEIIID